MRIDSFFSSIERTNIEISSLIVLFCQFFICDRKSEPNSEPIGATLSIALMLALPRNRPYIYLLGAVVAYSLWKWYKLSQNWKRGSHSLQDSDEDVAVLLFVDHRKVNRGNEVNQRTTMESDVAKEM